MNKKPALIISCIILLIALSVTVLGVSGLLGEKAQTAQQPFKSLIENRMNFTVSNTDFTFILDEEEESFLVTFTLTAAKTEADFYAVLDSITFSDAGFDSVIYEPAEGNGEYFDPNSLVMPVGTDGKPLTLSWNVTASFKYNAAQSSAVEPVLRINYTSGLKKDYADSHTLTVPFKVGVVNAHVLLALIDDAQSYIASGLYSQASCDNLQKYISSSKTALADKSKLTNEIIAGCCSKLDAAIQALTPKGN